MMTTRRTICLAVLISIFEVAAHAQPWSGLISSSRATDWTHAGVTGGIPSGTWTQCGSTIAAYSGTTDAINKAIAACGANQYVQLGAGTFNLASGGTISNGILINNQSNVALRGMGANQTFLIFAATAFDSCSGGYHSAICNNGSNGDWWVQDAGVNWTAGYTQGATVITLSSVAGIVPNKTIIGLDQCSAGNSGNPCSANPETDNGGYFDCDIQYNGSTGCAVNGPDGGNQRLNRPQNELFQVSAVNSSTNQVTLIGSLRDPNWNAAQSPGAYIASAPNQYVGIENLSIDTSAGASNSTHGITFYYAANSWVSGVRIIEPYYSGIYSIVGVHNTFQSNYIFANSTHNGTDIFTFNNAPTSDNLVQNNIVQWNQVCMGNEGADSGSVYAYNFCINDWNGNQGLYPATFPHAGDRWQLYEGNIANSYYGENYHGPKLMSTHFRNLYTGWDSCANGQCTTSPQGAWSSGTSYTAGQGVYYTNGFWYSCNSTCAAGVLPTNTSYWTLAVKGGGGNATTPFRMVAYSRYHNAIANVLGTPGYASSYSSTAGFVDQAIYEIGSNNGSIPVDPVVASTFFRWGNWDPVTNAVRWCGSASDAGWSTTCAATSEVPVSLSLYGQPIPTVGDTAAGMAALPASLFLSSKPSWWGSLPWPAIGPDVSNGGVGQCTGTLNTNGEYAGVAALSSSQCTGTSLAIAWGGHVNANPAMYCALSVMGMPPDGSNISPLSFNASTCYGGATAPSGGGTVTAPPTMSAAAH